MENSDKELSQLLEEVYDKTDVFDPSKHFKLLDVSKYNRFYYIITTYSKIFILKNSLKL